MDGGSGGTGVYWGTDRYMYTTLGCVVEGCVCVRVRVHVCVCVCQNSVTSLPSSPALLVSGTPNILLQNREDEFMPRLR